MRNTILKALFGTAVIILAVAVINVRADVRFGLSADDAGLNGFYLSISEYNRVPQKDVIVIRNHGIPDEELPVVFFLANKANVKPETVYKLRLQRMSWMEVALRLRLAPQVFVINTHDKFRPHYGNVFRFTDREIIERVNYRFVSDCHKYRPEVVTKIKDKHILFKGKESNFKNKTKIVYKYKIQEKKHKR
ncbi:MAG: hypothetical protein JXR81_10150 [Candidatus Goldbacteria bacterium]|nr:hypothetical protein [Candidatus Goldiibacteriota bacterium]